MARPTPSGIECVIARNSTSNGPTRNASPGSMGLIAARSSKLMLRQPGLRSARRPGVWHRSACPPGPPSPADTASPPMWSSWPWVMTMPRTWSALSLQVAEVGDDQVDAPHIVLGDHHPDIDDQDVAAVLVQRHVLADFPQAAQGDDAKFLCHNYHPRSMPSIDPIMHDRAIGSAFQVLLARNTYTSTHAPGVRLWVGRRCERGGDRGWMVNGVLRQAQDGVDSCRH